MSKVLLLLLAFGCACQGWKLNVRRVLLPLAEEGAKFRVFSEGTCYSYWAFWFLIIMTVISAFLFRWLLYMDFDSTWNCESYCNQSGRRMWKHSSRYFQSTEVSFQIKCAVVGSLIRYFSGFSLLTTMERSGLFSMFEKLGCSHCINRLLLNAS